MTTLWRFLAAAILVIGATNASAGSSLRVGGGGALNLVEQGELYRVQADRRQRGQFRNGRRRGEANRKGGDGQRSAQEAGW